MSDRYNTFSRVILGAYHSANIDNRRPVPRGTGLVQGAVGEPSRSTWNEEALRWLRGVLW